MTRKVSLEVRILQSLTGGLAFAFGGFYEFTGYIAGIVLGILLFMMIRKKANFKMYGNINSVAVLSVAVGYVVTVAYGADN